jgi:hypothetical protein
VLTLGLQRYAMHESASPVKRRLQHAKGCAPSVDSAARYTIHASFVLMTKIRYLCDLRTRASHECSKAQRSLAPAIAMHHYVGLSFIG